MIALLSRTYGKAQTTGYLIACNGDEVVFYCNTIEPQSNSNEENNSCINIGDYWVSKHDSPKFGKCFIIRDVVDRTNILIHSGNYRKDTHGCILVGTEEVTWHVH